MKHIVEAIIKELNEKRSDSFIVREDFLTLEDGYKFEVTVQINKEIDEICYIKTNVKFFDITRKDLVIDKAYDRVLLSLVEASLN